MKTILNAILIIFSVNSFAQCVKCKSLEEAQKKPEQVKSIQINSYLGGELSEIPANIGIYVNLEELFLTDLELTSVAKEIGDLSNLKSLSLAGNSLEKLPVELFKLKKLEEIILFSNNFSEEYKKQFIAEMKEKLPKAKVMID